MKILKNKIKKGVCLSALALLGACSGYLDINKDPNNLIDDQVTTPFLLPTVEVGTSFLVGNHLNLLQSCWMQQSAGTGTQTTQYDVYNVFPSDGEVNTAWTVAYAQLLPDLKAIIRKSTALEDFAHVGMAQVLQVYVMSLMTDAFGDIPFSDAGKGTSFNPKYDKQEDIYKQLLLDIDVAIENLKKTNKVNLASSGDIIYAGNTANWRRLARSLKLKMLLTIRLKNPQPAAISSLVADPEGFITTNASNFNVNYGTTSGAFHPLYQYAYLSRPNDLIISGRFLDSMRVNNDPRIPQYCTYTAASATGVLSYVTMDNGEAFTVGIGPPVRSRWGRYLTNVLQVLPSNATPLGTAPTPVRMITNSMVDFWLAEAALTMGTTGSDVTYFRQALKDHMDDVRLYCGIPIVATDAYETYINNRVTAYTALGSNTEAKLNMLMREKWLCSVGNAFESFNDIRRTGYPRLALPQNPTQNSFPASYPYPQDEINNNPANVPAGAPSMTDKVWWAK
jgi:hypothetical protein